MITSLLPGDLRRVAAANAMQKIALFIEDRIVLLEEGNAPKDFATEAMLHGARGVLWIVGDGRDDVRSQTQWANPEADYQKMPNIPIFRIRPSVAEEILEQAQITHAALLNGQVEVDQRGNGWFTSELNANVHLSLNLTEAENVEIEKHSLNYHRVLGKHGRNLNTIGS